MTAPDPNTTDHLDFDLLSMLQEAQSESTRLTELLLGGAVDPATDDEPAHNEDGA